MEARKSNRSDLEKKRFVFLEIGFIVALGLVFLAFNLKSYEKISKETLDRPVINTPEEMVPITEQKPPEPPKVVPPKIVTNIKIVDDNVKVDDDIRIDVGANQSTAIPDYIPLPAQKDEASVQDKEIFRVVETPPSFPGGEKALYQYLAENLKYPIAAKEANIQGKVFVTFVVEIDGSITQVKILRGIGGGCDQAALKVVENMPRWIPGKQRGIPVRVQFNLPVTFVLH